MSKHEKIYNQAKRFCISYTTKKRFIDIFVSLFFLVLFSPIIFLFCILIFLSDPTSNPIFIQERCGENKKTFKMYKIRTMYTNAEDVIDEIVHMNEANGPVFKIKDDKRIIPIGKFMRKTQLDELPQFINVIKGDMSIVGPRPPLMSEVESYEEWQLDRLCVKPGMTCYWQITDNRHDILFDDWVRLDLKYIKEQSIKTDIKIFFLTLKPIFKMNGE